MIPAVSTRTPTSVGSRSIRREIADGSGGPAMGDALSTVAEPRASCNDAGAMMNSHSIGWLVDETLCNGVFLTTVLAQRGAGITSLHVNHEAIEELPVPALCLG